MKKTMMQYRGAVAFNANMLDAVEKAGYKYVQIKGLNADKHYDYYAPRSVLLIPLRELPTDQRDKDIYEPVPSPVLAQWAEESDDHFKIFIAYPS